MSRWDRKGRRARDRAEKVRYRLVSDPIVETTHGVVTRLGESPGVAAVTVLLHPDVSTGDAIAELRILTVELEELASGKTLTRSLDG